MITDMTVAQPTGPNYVLKLVGTPLCVYCHLFIFNAFKQHKCTICFYCVCEI